MAGRCLIHRMTCSPRNSEDAFIRRFVTGVLQDVPGDAGFLKIEQLRKALLADSSPIGSFDPGAGSHSSAPERSVATFTRRASVSPRYGRLLHRIAKTYQPPVILELGTAVGLGTLYLATALPHARVITIEGNPRIAERAEENFRRAGTGNITLIRGEFDRVLPQLYGELPAGSLVYIDGNHTGEALQRYFTLLATYTGANLCIFDDINWSESMHHGWQSIRNSGREGLWIDLFRMGLYLGNYPGASRFMKFSY